MSGDFFDSNVLLHLTSDDPVKRRLARETLDRSTNSGQAVISFQVVQEVLNRLLRRSGALLQQEEVRHHLEELLLPLWRVHPSQALYRRALDIHWRHKYAFYDSLIIAAALDGGCTRLLSEDLQDGQRIEGMTIVNPFRTSQAV